MSNVDAVLIMICATNQQVANIKKEEKNTNISEKSRTRCIHVQSRGAWFLGDDSDVSA